MIRRRFYMPKIEEPLKTKRFSGMFRFIEKTAQRQAVLADSHNLISEMIHRKRRKIHERSSYGCPVGR